MVEYHQVLPQGVQLISQDPLDILARADKAFIKQKVELLEVFTGCETKNRYHVYIHTTLNENIYLFKCKESSGWCMRNCCASESRAFNMKVKHMQNEGEFRNDQYDDQKKYAEFNRPFKCTCFCLSRPEMNASILKQNIGKVVDPFNCCDEEFNIYDTRGELRWRVSASCCQCGILFRKSCGVCCTAQFPIFKGSRTDLDRDSADGMITKKSTGLSEVFTDADSFVLTFPGDATPEEKMLLISTVLMIDYRLYEDTGDNSKNRNY